jgi:hypothetical protein
LLAPAAGTGLAETPAHTGRVDVAKASYLAGRVEVAPADGPWRPFREGDRLAIGERLRTEAGALARLEFPWMRLNLGPASLLRLPSGGVLSVVLEQGRLEILSDGEIIKVVTAEVLVRGEGRGVVRRENDRTLVMVWDGRFQLTAAGQSVTLSASQSSVVAPGSAPAPARALPESPLPASPLADPVYVKPGSPAALSWSGEGTSFHIQVLPIDSDDVLVEHETGPSPFTLRLPWLGLFRWRVSGRDPLGVESAPSGEGLICVVEE